MIKKSFALILFFLTTTNLFAQEKIVRDSVVKPVIKLSFLDSLKNTYVIDETSDCIDNQYIKELSNTQDIFDGIVADIKNLDLDKPVDFDLPTDVFKERLRLMDEKSPFNIDYNPQLENLVKNFLKNRKRSYERLMGLSQYYFPLFEEAMARYNVPLEIKYLAIVESALRSSAVSRVGATGLWQFMYETGKQYGLKIDSYLDERKDTYKATDAAARYMEGMYKIFGDWEMVLASYNSGAGNVSKAIRRSGGQQNFWNVKKYLPRETQSYVPAFLATMYIFEYHKEHGIVPEKAVVNHFETDTIAVKRKMSFKQLSNLLDVPVSDIEFLNPAYKTKVIPYVTGRTNYICLPKKKVAVFASNEEKMYAYVDYEEQHREKYIVPSRKKRTIVTDTISSAIAAVSPAKSSEGDNSIIETKKIYKNIERIKFHTVRSGDNLSDIAERYEVSIADLKNWNHLRGNNVQMGKRLRIVVEDKIAVIEKVRKPKSEVELTKEDITTKNETTVAELDSKSLVKKESKKAKEMKPEVAVVEKQKVHIVGEGETLTSIAKENRLYVADLNKWNSLKDGKIKLGDKLKLAPNIDLNTVSDIVENDKKEQNDQDIYIVKKGENIFQIAKSNNVKVQDILNWNNLTTTNIKVGDKLLIEKSTELLVENNKAKIKSEDLHLYIVQKGDSLFKISQTHHTTVAELKKKNNIKEDDLKPGMKLKI